MTGVALRYGEVSPYHRERFEAGAFGNLADGRTRWLNLRHRPREVIAHTASGELRFTDSPEALRFEAELPDIPAADAALDEVRSGRIDGISIEFHAQRERRDDGIRVVEAATLDGIGLVGNPSYLGSRAEVRAGGFRSTIPYNAVLGCECHSRAPKASNQCEAVQFAPGVFGRSVADRATDQLAVIGTFEHAVAAKSKNTLRIRETPAGLDVRVSGMPDTQAVLDVLAQSESVPVYARPIFRSLDASDFTERMVDGRLVAFYSGHLFLRGILIGPADRSLGWTPIVFAAGDDDDSEPRSAPASVADDPRWEFLV